MSIKREETAHVRVGERNIHQHIKKISAMYVNNGHKTDVHKEGGKHFPNKMKHISPL